jgi:poly-beta-1,6-N-acetyl-D-glucosamine synthase
VGPSGCAVTPSSTRALPDYDLVCAARDEADHLGALLSAVLSQTTLPRRFVVVSDGSRDRTADVVAEYAARSPLVRLIRRDGTEAAGFGSKAMALGAGVRELGAAACGYLGVLDADITFEPEYFEVLLGRMEADPGIGIGGGVITEQRGARWAPLRYNYQMSVAGAVQFFRRPCFDAVGGYPVLPRGGIDTVVEATARMQGWQVRTFPDIPAYHHRPLGSRSGGGIRAQVRYGIQEHANGYSPFFQVFRMISRLGDRPVVIGSITRTLAYFAAKARRVHVAAPPALVRYLRREQRGQVRSALRIKRGA